MTDMTGLAIEKIYVLLSDEDALPPDHLEKALTQLLPYANVNANLYLVMGHLPEVPRNWKSSHLAAGRDLLARLDRFFGVVQRHLNAYPFTRVFVHLVHPVSSDALDQASLGYEYFKQKTEVFDQEGYMHQEVPRLMVLPLVVTDAHTDWPSLGMFLTSLKRSFLPPSVCVRGNLEDLSGEKIRDVPTEKIYWAVAPPGELPRLACCLAHQDIVDDASSRLAAEMDVAEPCPQSLFISASDGCVFSCLDSFERKTPLVVIGQDGEAMLDALALGLEDRQSRASSRTCLACKERLARSFCKLPLATEARHETGALLYHLATLYEAQGRLDEAIRGYKAALPMSVSSQTDAIHFRLGLCHTKTGSYDEALKDFETARATYENTYFLHFYTGLCSFQLGDFASALDDFFKAEALNPPVEDLVQILIYRGTCHNYMGQYEEGLRPLERAKELDGNIKEIWSTLGFSYFQLKQFDTAIKHLGRAVELDPSSAVDFASLGANYREKGDVPKAITMFEKALELDPTMDAAKKNLERLKNAP